MNYKFLKAHKEKVKKVYNMVHTQYPGTIFEQLPDQDYIDDRLNEEIDENILEKVLNTYEIYDEKGVLWCYSEYFPKISITIKHHKIDNKIGMLKREFVKRFYDTGWYVYEKYHNYKDKL